MTSDKVIKMEVDTHSLGELVGGIHDLAESLIPSAFGYTAAYYLKNKTEQKDWFCEQYSIVAGAIRLISAAAQVVDIGLVNGEIKFDRGLSSDIKQAVKKQETQNNVA